MIANLKIPAVFVAIVLGLGVADCYANSAKKPIWSRQAIALDLSCSQKPTPISSPDHRYRIDVLCRKQSDKDPTYSLRVKAATGQSYEASLDEGAHELLWAPNSRAFFVNGSTTSYAGFFVEVYKLIPGGLRKENISAAAQGDMVASFPPCKAYNRDEATCTRIAAHPEYNMSGIAWIADSSAINVFAEVPCSSSYGGIMCQVLGYQLSASDGRILKRFKPAEMRQQWQKSMAWKMRVPDPPECGPANVTF
jgi:hypothetical protein